jgi:hypothetical protein
MINPYHDEPNRWVNGAEGVIGNDEFFFEYNARLESGLNEELSVEVTKVTVVDKDGNRTVFTDEEWIESFVAKHSPLVYGIAYESLLS